MVQFAAAAGLLSLLLAADALQEARLGSWQSIAFNADVDAGKSAAGGLWGFIAGIADPGVKLAVSTGDVAAVGAVGTVGNTAAGQRTQGDRAEGTTIAQGVKDGIVKIIFGVIFVSLAVPIHWFNEDRSARLNTLLVRGQNECVSLDSAEPRECDRGRLVHVQGKTRSIAPLADSQFLDAEVKSCLKLQSTVEVFEWAQQLKTWVEGSERKSQSRFHTEWTTVHYDSLRFKKPSPENPRLPTGLTLGTATRVCNGAQLGGFLLTEDMVRHFHKFEPAMPHLPDKLTARGLVFFANRQDGYYYARPGAGPATARSGPRPFHEHQVGDVRARFMLVPEGDATVVAVQCQRSGGESFVPFRPIARAPWAEGARERQKLIEEGDRPLKDLRRESSCCCTGGVASCCCCTCNAIAHCCKEEVITEEIFHISDRLEPKEKAFEHVVQRNPCRVWNFRVAGWCLMFWGTSMIIGPLMGSFSGSPNTRVYRGALSAIVTLAAHTSIIAVAYSCYRPLAAFQWLCVTAAVLAAPVVLGELT